MKMLKVAVLPVVILLTTCHVFLGPDPDFSPAGILHSLWNDFNEIHAYIDIRMSTNRYFNNWEEVYEHYKNDLITKTADNGMETNRLLFEACGSMLGQLSDPHVGLFAPGGASILYDIDPGFAAERLWFDRWRVREHYLLNGDHPPGGTGGFMYGIIESAPSVGYIHIPSFRSTGSESWISAWVEEIDDIITYMHDNNAEALILDIRNNEGGSIINMGYIANRFTSVQRNYLQSSTKNGPGRNDFTVPEIFMVKPSDVTFTRYTVLLTNKASVSAAEWFTLAMKTQPHVRHLGTATRGAFSGRQPRSMINGWYYTISAQKVTDMDGICYEGIGVSPESAHVISGDWGEEQIPGVYSDRQLNKALEEVLQRLNK